MKKLIIGLFSIILTTIAILFIGYHLIYEIYIFKELSMHKERFLTFSHARVECVRTSAEPIHWIFLPGGPGLGSESLKDLVNLLFLENYRLPGNAWLLDLPGDGSNNMGDFQNWQRALVEAMQALPKSVIEKQKIILVAHSTGGMYALSTPELEPLLDGLVLLDSAPDAGWQAEFAKTVENHPIPGLNELHEQYQAHPSNETLKTVTIASAPWLFTNHGMAKGIKMLKDLPYNYQTCQWSDQHFDKTYSAQWIPQTIPTLILAGQEDLIIPLHLFTTRADFNRPNITITAIKNAGHFPWIDNPQDVFDAFRHYQEQFFEKN